MLFKLQDTKLLFVSFSVSLIEGKQRLLLLDIQHHLTTQHFYNTVLRQMRNTQLSHTDTQVCVHANVDIVTLIYMLNIHTLLLMLCDWSEPPAGAPFRHRNIL